MGAGLYTPQIRTVAANDLSHTKIPKFELEQDVIIKKIEENHRRRHARRIIKGKIVHITDNFITIDNGKYKESLLFTEFSQGRAWLI